MTRSWMRPCTDCTRPLAPTEAHYRVDDANNAINKNALPYCLTCFGTRFGFPAPRLEDLHHQNKGVLGVHNLLASGDFAGRVEARARFMVTATNTGSVVLP